MNDTNKNDDLNEDLEFNNEFEDLETDEVEVEESLEAKLKSLRHKLSECEKEKMNNLEDLHRTKADFLNAKKRLEDSRKQDTERLTNSHIEKLLPLCDSFSMAMSNEEAWGATDSTWRSGIEGIFNQLQSILNDYGVTAVVPTGEVFNPVEHDAVANVPVADKTKDGTIVSVVQNGYVRNYNGNTMLIRPAKVTVGEFTG